MGQISKRSYDEVAAAIRKMKATVIADPATSHLLVAVVIMQKEIARSFSENNSAFRPDMFATACEPLFKPGRMGKQPAPVPAVTSDSEQSPVSAPLTVPLHEALAKGLAERRASDEAQEMQPRTERRTIKRADLYGSDRRKQKPD